MRGPLGVRRNRPSEFGADFGEGGCELGEAAPVSGVPAPLARANTVSLVLVCPSTETQLKLAFAAL